jgi:hypothetical protein
LIFSNKEGDTDGIWKIGDVGLMLWLIILNLQTQPIFKNEDERVRHQSYYYTICRDLFQILVKAKNAPLKSRNLSTRIGFIIEIGKPVSRYSVSLSDISQRRLHTMIIQVLQTRLGWRIRLYPSFPNLGFGGADLSRQFTLLTLPLHSAGIDL